MSVVFDAFMAAAREGDFERLAAVLDPDIVLRADGGALTGLSRVVRGASAVAAQATTFSRSGLSNQLVLVNQSWVCVASLPRAAVFRRRVHDRRRQGRGDRYPGESRASQPTRPVRHRGSERMGAWRHAAKRLDSEHRNDERAKERVRIARISRAADIHPPIQHEDEH